MLRSRNPVARLIVPSIALTMALVLTGLPGTGGEAAAVTTHTAFTIEGEAGAYIGGGTPQVYTPPDATFATEDQYQSTTREWIFLHVSGVNGTAEGHGWYVNLAAPLGEDLAVGAYTGATRAAFRQPGEPGIDIFGDGNGCDPIGEFTIHELAFTGDVLTSLAASYSFHCYATSNPETSGEVRYNSTMGFAGLRQVPNVSPNAISFGDVILGSSAPERTIDLVNAGTTSIEVTGVGASGPNTADFAMTTNMCNGEVLDPGDTCSLGWTFTPGGAGGREALGTYTTDTNDYDHGVRLLGTGVAPQPNLQVTPGEASFGSILLGAASPATQFTVTSTGNVPVDVGPRSIVGDNPGDFEITSDTCPVGDLAVSASCTIAVRFAPTTEGSRSATLAFAADVWWAPVSLPLAGTGTRPSSGISWGTRYKPGGSYTWTFGNALGRTVQSGTQRLHQGYATDRISGSWARDTGGPYAGIYYTRSSAGSTWSTPRRITPTSKHAIRFGLAAASSRVYVAYVTQTRLYNYSPTAPRVLYVRRNTNHGIGTSWRDAVRLTSTTGRVDYPSIAASGYDVHVAWTNSVTGNIVVATSKDRGVSFTKRIIGTAAIKGSSGYTGLPKVAVSGSTVAVTWVSDVSGTVKTRVSTDRGSTWGTTTTVGSQSIGYVSTAVRGSRIAVTWTTDDDVVVRLRTSGTWGAPMVVASLAAGANPVPYAPVVLLQDPNRIAVGWSEEEDGDFAWARLRWAESPDNGKMWHVTQTLASTSSSTRRSNDWASAVWPSASKRYVTWNGWTQGTNYYRQYIRVGTGAPVATVAATTWEPAEVTGAPRSTVRITDDGAQRVDSR